MAKAILIIDMLNDFVNETVDGKREYRGALVVQGATTLVENIRKIKDTAREQGVLVVYGNDAHEPNDIEFSKYPPHAIKWTYGAQVISELSPCNGDVIIEKQDLPLFTNRGVDRMLREGGIDELVLAGVAIEYCIRDVALDTVDKYGNPVHGAISRGYKVSVVVDAIAGIDEIRLPDGSVVPDTKGSVARALLEMGNKEVRPVYTRQLLEELVRN